MSSPSTDPAAAAPATAPTAALRLPAGTRVDLISDLHLSPASLATAAAWRAYLRSPDWDVLLILGDLFEAWVGDDGAEDGFEAESADALQQAAASRPVWFMHGNRDFLVGERFFQRTGIRPMADPCRLEIGSHAWLLSHGDALCVSDRAYQDFRRTVRDPAWQAAFLLRPLALRQATARALRDASEQRQAMGSDGNWVDVDRDAAIATLHAHGLTTLIHGHTHRPAEHGLADGLKRIVLSDWDVDTAVHPRAEALRVDATGSWRRVDLLSTARP